MHEDLALTGNTQAQSISLYGDSPEYATKKGVNHCHIKDEQGYQASAATFPRPLPSSHRQMQTKLFHPSTTQPFTQPKLTPAAGFLQTNARATAVRVPLESKQRLFLHLLV